MKRWMRGRRRQSAPWGSWHLVTPNGRSVCGKFDAATQYRLERSKSEPGVPCKNCVTAAFFDLERREILRLVQTARGRVSA